MFKLMKKSEYDFLLYIKEDYDQKSNEWKEMQLKLTEKEQFADRVRKKLRGVGAVVYDIKKDRDDNETFVCIQDCRKPCLKEDNADFYMKGDLNIFVISPRIIISGVDTTYKDMPYLEAEFQESDIDIIELHSDIAGSLYENKGYGTMLIECLISLGEKENCTSIYGKLSSVDAETDEKRDNRNRFYEHGGFDLKFKDETKKDGSVYKKLGNLNRVGC